MTAFSLKILIVEDNDDLREGWMAFFRSQGHHVKGVAFAAELLEESGTFSPDIYLIDLNLPDDNGLNLVKRLRAVHPNAGLIITTARNQIGDKVAGYDSGADIYFTKPVNTSELMAAMNVLGQRRLPSTARSERLYLQLDRHVIDGPGGSANLTPMETNLLASLIRAQGQALERWQLAELLGAGDALPSSANLDMRISRLRKKLAAAGAEPPCIRSVYGRGYTLVSPVYLAST